VTSYAQRLLDRKAAAPSGPGYFDSRPVARAAAAPVATADAAPLPAALAKFPVNMKVSDVAAYFNISEDAVLLFRDSGDMEFVNIGTGPGRPTWRISRASVAAFERQHQTAVQR
jgi:hypothetical protein